MPDNILMLLGGVVIGLIVGALPGLSDSIAIAVLIPVTFGMEPQLAMCLLVGIYCSSCYGGSIPAILLKIPGTASSVVTAWDGYEMTKKGQSGLALGISTFSSVFGGISSSLVLLFLSPLLAREALRFGPPEYFMLALLGLSSVVGMASNDILRNLLILLLGLVFSCIGMSPQTGYTRFAFGVPNLMDGIPFVPMLIGLFGVTATFEVIENTPKNETIQQMKENYRRIRSVLPDKALIKQLLPVWIRSSIIGNIIGIIPGAGMVMAVYLAYDQAVRVRPDLKFGTGLPEGIAAPEAANNAVVASSMVPLLSLGIPGNSTSALFLGALNIQGLRPGPSLFKNYPEVAFLVLAGFLIANIFMLPVGLLFCNFIASWVLRLRRDILSGIVLILCVTGSFAVNNSIFNITVMLVFGLVGYLLNKMGLPQSPLILAVILGPMMENNFIQSMAFAGGSFLVFVTRPISCVLLIISVYFLLRPVIKQFRRKLIQLKIPEQN
jgi:putative tricarboxylic transport membrane protein